MVHSPTRFAGYEAEQAAAAGAWAGARATTPALKAHPLFRRAQDRLLSRAGAFLDAVFPVAGAPVAMGNGQDLDRGR